MRPSRSRTLVLLALPLALAAVAACAGQARTAAPAKAEPATGVAFATAAPAAAGLDAKRSGGGGQTGEVTSSVPVPRAFDPDRKLILTASVTLESKDAWTVADRIQGIASGLGGDVLQLSQSGKDDQRTATLTIRVPQDRFNEALRRIRGLEDVSVLSSTVQGQDVTDQFVDLEARLAAKKAEEQRYLALLGRANNIDEILKVDANLSQVRMQIEQLQAQVNSIAARTTFSTITVQVSPPSPFPTTEPKPVYDPAKTAERALTALVQVLRFGVDAAIWALVFGWIPLVLFGLVLLVSRARARSAPAA